MHEPRYTLNRRRCLQLAGVAAIGSGVIGTCLPGLANSAVAAEPVSAGDGVGRAKSVLIVYLSGGPSQLDMLDPKAEAPAEVRGEFAGINTTIPGVAVCEHLPRLAQ